jgi:hypothetical protein
MDYRRAMGDDIEFRFDFSGVTELEFHPYMIETAYKYLKVAAVTDIGHIRSVTSALALEILFKSFNAKAVENIGAINEKYKFIGNLNGPDRHDLIKLWEIIPTNIQNVLLRSSDDLRVIEEHRTIFVLSRYAYEPDAPKSNQDSLFKLTYWFVFVTITLYRSKGCTDLFIQCCEIDNEMKEMVSRRWFLPLL